MAASPSQSRAIKTAGGRQCRLPGLPIVQRPGLVPVPPEPPLEWDWWTPEAMKGWAGSFGLHIVLLLILALLVFLAAAPQSGDIRLAAGRVT